MSLQELLAQRDELARQTAELQKAIADAQSAARKEVLAKIRALMAEHGVTVADLQASPKSSSAKADKSPRTGTKVAAKYRDPQTGNAWSGRGLQPKWLKAALAEGRKIEDFAV